MKAIVQHEYGAPQDVLGLADVEMPVVGAEDVLVSVRASSANPWDWHYIRGDPALAAFRALHIGCVFQRFFLLPILSALDHVAAGCCTTGSRLPSAATRPARARSRRCSPPPRYSFG